MPWRQRPLTPQDAGLIYLLPSSLSDSCIPPISSLPPTTKHTIRCLATPCAILTRRYYYTLTNDVVAVQYSNDQSPDQAWSPSIPLVSGRPPTTMSSSRRHSMRPVIVEVKPDSAPTSNIAPSSPASPKAVRFAPKSEDRASRPLSSTEAWSLYHFENHARHCPACYYPLEVYRRGEQLCPAGHGLAQDVAYHVYHLNGEVYSTTKDDNSKLVRVEVPHGYHHLRSLLRSMESRLRSHRTAPVISYDRTYPVSARKSWTPETEPENVVLEPATSSRRRSTHRPVRYSTVIVDDDIEDVSAVTSKPSTIASKERRGTLYEKELQRKPKDYRVEIREPSDSRKERRRHRDSGVFF